MAECVPVKFRDYDGCGDIMTLDEFMSGVDTQGLMSDDGSGEYACCNDKTLVSDIEVRMSAKRMDHPKWATHVVWYNK